MKPQRSASIAAASPHRPRPRRPSSRIAGQPGGGITGKPQRMRIPQHSQFVQSWAQECDYLGELMYCSAPLLTVLDMVIPSTIHVVWGTGPMLTRMCPPQLASPSKLRMRLQRLEVSSFRPHCKPGCRTEFGQPIGGDILTIPHR